MDTGFLEGLAGANGTVYTLAMRTDGKVLAGGNFGGINGVPSSGVARLWDRGTPAEAAFVTGTTLGISHNSWSGWAGMRIQVGANPVVVTALGRMVVAGNTATHTVKLVKAREGTEVPGGAVEVATSGGVADEFQYANLNSPVALAAGADYYVVSQEKAGGDRFYSADTMVTTTPVADVITAVADDYSGGWVFPLGAGHTYGPVDFKYADLPAVTVVASDATAGEPGTGQGPGTFTFSRTGPTTAALTANLTVSGTATSETDFQILGTTVTFAAGSATATVPLNVLDDPMAEGDETIVVTLAGGTGYVVGSPSAVAVTIEDGERPALITAAPRSTSALVGGRAVFTVMASGNPPLAYQWWRDGAAMADGTNDTLILTRVQWSMAGNYSVTVSNRFGGAASAAAALAVNPPKAGDVDISFAPGSTTAIMIKSLAVQPDGKILIGGVFDSITGALRGNVARLNRDGSTDYTFLNGLAGADSEVTSVVQSDGKVVIGRVFDRVNGVLRRGVARLKPDGALDLEFLQGLAGADGTVGSVAVQSDGKVLIGGRSPM